MLLLLIPCLDGWGLDEDAGLMTARLAVDSGAFPLYEVEDGERYTLQSAKTRPVADYLAVQGRYRHLAPAQVAMLQQEIDAGWERLHRLAAKSQMTAGARTSAPL